MRAPPSTSSSHAFLPSLLTDRQTVQNPPGGSQLLSVPPWPLKHKRGCHLSSLPVSGDRGVQAPCPAGGTLGGPSGMERRGRLAPGAGCACLLCTTFHSGEEFGLLDGWWRHSLTKPCLLSGTLAAPDDSPKEALPSRLSQLSLPSSLFPTPGLRPILGHLLTHSLLTSQRCSVH